MSKAGEGLVLFMWRQLGRNEEYFAQFESAGCALGNNNVSAMNGIEGTAEKGDIHEHPSL